VYIKGEDNIAADALSRMPDDEPTAGLAACALAYTRTSSTTHQCPWAAPQLMPAAAAINIEADRGFVNDIREGYNTDEFAKQVRDGIRLGSALPGTREDETGFLYVANQLLIPDNKDVRETLYHLAHDTLGHFGFDKSYASLRDAYYWPNMRRDLQTAYIPSCAECQ